MFLDIIPILENGASAKFPKARRALRIFMILRPTSKTLGTPSGGYTFRDPQARARSRGRAAAL